MCKGISRIKESDVCKISTGFNSLYMVYICCCCSVAKLCPALLQPHGLQTARLLCPWDFPGKNTRMDFHFLLWEIFPSSVQLSRSVVSDSLWPQRLQYTRPPFPLPTPRVYSNSCPLSRWCHPTISSSVVPFSSHLQSFPASGSFQMSHPSHQVAKVLEFQLQHQSFQWILRTNFL